MPQRSEICQPLTLAAIVALGFGTVWAALVSWGINAAKDVLGPEEPSEYLMFRMDGTPVVGTRLGKNEYNRIYRTLEGNSQPIARNESFLRDAYLLARPRERNPMDPSVDAPWYSGRPWNDRIAGWNDAGEPMTYWYFVLDTDAAGKGYFAGFDAVTNGRVGFIGRQGFQADRPPLAQRFSVERHEIAMNAVVGSDYAALEGSEPWLQASSRGPGFIPPWIAYVLADEGVVEVDFLKRSTRLILEQPGVISAYIAERGMTTPVAYGSAEYHLIHQVLAVRTEDRVLVLDAGGKQQTSFAIPESLRHEDLSLYLLSDSTAMLDLSAKALRRWNPRNRGEDRLVWIDNRGKTIREKAYSLKRTWEPTIPPWPQALKTPAPLAVATVAAALAPWYWTWSDEQPTFADGLRKSWSEFPLPLAAICLLGAALAGLCYRRQQRYGLPWTKTWMVFVFLGGLPAVVGYLAHRRWPVVEKCPACGRAVPHDREMCVACGGEFPEPAPKGTEVLA